MQRFFSFFVASSLLSLCLAGPLTPLEPAPGEMCTQGGPLHLSWAADTTGAWKGTTIELMTGANLDMVHLTTIATIDGTDATNTSLTIPCPFVTPHSAIYFFQFSSTAGAMWTGRITIVGPDGASVPPANPTQPDGSNIPWGTGALVPPSFPGSPPPLTAPPGQTDASNVNGAVSGGGASSNSTEGLNASSAPGSSASSSSAQSTPSGFSRSSSVQPTPASDPDVVTTTISSTTPSSSSNSSGTSNSNSATAPFLSGFSATAIITLLTTTFTFTQLM